MPPSTAPDTAGHRQPWLFAAALVGSAVAFAVGVAVVMVGTDCNPTAEDFSRETEYRSWAAMIGLNFAVAAWAAVAWLRSSAQLYSRHSTGIALVPSFVVIGLAFGAVVVARTIDELDLGAAFCRADLRISIVTYGLVGLALPALVLMDIARQVAMGLAGDPTEVGPFLAVRRALDRATVQIGLVFAVAIVSTSVLRQAIIEGGGEYEGVRLVIFGLGYSTLILVFYWPAHSSLERVAEEMKESVSPLPDLDAPDLEAIHKRREIIDQTLGVATSPVDRIQAQLSVAAPLVTSLIGSIVSGGS